MKSINCIVFSHQKLGISRISTKSSVHFFFFLPKQASLNIKLYAYWRIEGLHIFHFSYFSLVYVLGIWIIHKTIMFSWFCLFLYLHVLCRFCFFSIGNYVYIHGYNKRKTFLSWILWKHAQKIYIFWASRVFCILYTGQMKTLQITFRRIWSSIICVICQASFQT